MNKKNSVKDFFLTHVTNEKEVLKTLFKIIIKKENSIIQNETFKLVINNPRNSLIISRIKITTNKIETLDLFLIKGK